MAHTRDDAVAIARGFLRAAARRHGGIRRAFLFGSSVWGEPTTYSDIDLAVVLESSSEEEGSPFGKGFALFHEAQEYNSALEVVCLSREEFEDDTYALVRRIKRDGVELPISEDATRPA